jgi:BMFP domain-containing protein YqiC
MQGQNQFFDDLAKVTTGAMGTLAGMGRELEQQFRDKLRDWVGGDLVTREEFDAVREMAAAARAEVEALKAELAAMRASAAPAQPATDPIA